MFCVLQSPKCSRAGGGKETHRESARNCKFMIFVLINKVVVVASGELNVFAWWRLKKVRLFRRIVFTDTHLLKWPVVAWTTWSPEIGSECSAPTHNATHLFWKQPLLTVIRLFTDCFSRLSPGESRTWPHGVDVHSHRLNTTWVFRNNSPSLTNISYQPCAFTLW